MKSFINSLPSHRKKKSRLKQKYNSRQTTIPFAPSDKRIASYDDAIERGNSLIVTTSLHSSSGGFGAVRPPPPARVSLENEFHPLGDEESNAGGDHADLEVLSAVASAEVNHAGLSQETTMLQRDQAKQSLTESLANADFHHEVQKYGTKRPAPSNVILSPVHSSSAAARDQLNLGIEEEEMVGILGSPRGGKYDDCENIDFEKIEASTLHGTHELGSLVETKKPAYHELDRSIATNDNSFNLNNTDVDRNDRQSVEYQVEPGERTQPAKKEDVKRHENIHTHRDNGCVHRNHSLDTEPITKVREKMGEPSGDNKSVGDEKKNGMSPDSAIFDAEPKEFLLTTSDITGCVDAMEVARKILESDPYNDPFDGIDIDLWKSIFEDFKKYIAAFDDSTSFTDDNELKNINENEKAFAIFDRGMNVNHCNVVFIYDMICTISRGISQCRSDSPIDFSGCKNKLDHLAECIDMIFRVNKRASSHVSVSISKLAGDNSTVLKFCVSSGSSDDGKETTTLSTLQNPSPTILPPHLQAMSQVFSQFASDTARPLQWQVGSTRETLAATREGAKDLQRQALALQDELYDAQVKAEAEFARQTEEFQRKVDSFEHTKVQYQVELASMKERYERALEEMKAELAMAKNRTNDRKDAADDRNERNQNIMHLTSPITPQPKPNECVLDYEANEEPISQSIPRNIEFLAPTTVYSDMEGSKGLSDRSKDVSRAAPPGWFGPLQTMSPLRHRVLPAPTIQNDEHVYRGYGRMGSSSQRNILTSIAENRTDHASATGFCQKGKSVSTSEKADPQERVKSKQSVSSPEKRKVAHNPLVTEAKPLKNILKETDNNSEPSFAYEEVVRGAKRQALPGHECEECRKFLDALGKGFNRDEIVMKCSRHRARYAPQSTPPDFWRLTFVDSVASKKSSENNGNSSLCSSF